MVPEHHAVVVIGAGWAGLSVGYKLREAGIGHVILERARVCETWRTQRWDSFRMNTPNVLTVLPGDSYDGHDPEGYMTRDDFVAMVEDYVRRNDLRVRENTRVEEVRPVENGFLVCTSSEQMNADHVVVATGNLNVPALAGTGEPVSEIRPPDRRDRVSQFGRAAGRRNTCHRVRKYRRPDRRGTGAGRAAGLPVDRA